MRRIVSVWLPQWPIDRLTWEAARGHLQPPPDEVPFALAEAGPRGLTVTAANAAAQAEGVHPGLGLADARARAPHLLSAPAETDKDARALAGLARWCGRYAPAFNVDGHDGLWIDIDGAAHMLGGEQGLLADLEHRLRDFGLTARLGLADTLGAAWALARYASPVPALARPGAQGEALTPLPVEGLRLDAEALTLLKRLGLKRIGQLCDLPRAQLKRRFPSNQVSQAVLTRLDQALGHVREPLKSLQPSSRHSARLIFTEPLISHEGFETALQRLTRELCATLASSLAGVRTLSFTAWRTNGSRASLRCGFAAPCREPAHLMRLLLEKTALLDMASGIDAMALDATGVERIKPEQASLTAGEAAAPLAPLVDRLANRLGARRVYRLIPRESYIPERAVHSRSALQGMANEISQRIEGCKERRPPRPPLLLARPEPIDVLAEVPEGPPLRFTWRRVTRRVRHWQGPERIAPEWWDLATPASSSAGLTRDYYRIEDETGGRYWVFRAGLYGDRSGVLPRWYLHGAME